MKKQAVVNRRLKYAFSVYAILFLTVLMNASSANAQRTGIIINEALYDPEGVDTGLEWIEIVNTSIYSVNLQDYDLRCGSGGFYTFGDFLLTSGSYVVVHNNAEGEDTATDLYTGPTSNMGNTHDSIVLFNSTTHSTGTIVDFVQYGAGGESWESTAVGAGIWTEGDYVPDVTEGSSIGLCPNGADNDSSADWQELTITTAGGENECSDVTVTPTPFSTDVPDPTDTPTAFAESPTPGPTGSPLPCNVAINEVLYDPEGPDTAGEYIELFNPCAFSIDISEYSLRPEDEPYIYIEDGTILAPSEFLTVTVESGGMGNSDGSVSLFDSDSHTADTIIDFVQWGAGGQWGEDFANEAGIWTLNDFVADAEEGNSINLNPDGDDNDDPADWEECFPSIGSANCATTPTDTPTSPPSPTNTPTPTNTEGPGTPTNTPTDTPEETPTDTPTIVPTPTPTGSPLPCNVTINEVLYDPEGPDTAGEYIEIYNPCAFSIDISEYSLRPEDEPYIYIEDGTILAPSEFLTVTVESGGMGNTDGSVSLFDSDSHTADTIIDFVQWGAAGQWGEDLATEAGIWTEGDFAADAEEGNSINLNPDGDDNDDPADWEECFPSIGGSNCSTGTPAPTMTPTNTPSPTPTSPTNTPTYTPTGPTNTPTLTPSPTGTVPLDCDIVINEVLYDPEGTDTGNERIELFNPCIFPVDVSEYSARPEDDPYIYIPDGTIIQPGEFLVLIVESGGMGNTDGSASLFNSDSHTADTIIDFVQWGDAGQWGEALATEAGIWTEGDFAADAEEGNSINLNPDGDDNDDPADWEECFPSIGGSNCSTGTPAPTMTPTNTPSPTPTGPTYTPTNTPTGPTNTPTLPPSPTDTVPPDCDIVINEVLYDPEGTDTGNERIELFNPCIFPVDVSEYSARPEDDPYIYIPDGTIIQPGEFLVLIVESGGMGNTDGSASLFNSNSHTADTIIDFVQWGAAGQWGEDLADEAGIWTEGDFAADAEEGNSINLNPDGDDNDDPADWEECFPSIGETNCSTPFTNTPTVTTTPTITPTIPTLTPTLTPTPTTTGPATNTPTWTPTPTSTGSPYTHTPPPTPSGSVTPSGTPTIIPEIPMGLRINEIMCDPENDFTGEFVELINAGDNPAFLTSLRLQIGGGPGAQKQSLVLFPGTIDAVIQPGETALILEQNYDGQYDDTICPDTPLLMTESGMFHRGLEHFLPIKLFGYSGVSLIDEYRGSGLKLENRSIARVGTDRNNQRWIASPCKTRYSGIHSAGKPNCTFEPPENNGPVVWAAGFGSTYLTAQSGGLFTMMAAVTDPDGPNDIQEVEILYNGQPSNVYLGKVSDGYYETKGGIPAFSAPEEYRLAFELEARDKNGNKSDMWPFFHIKAPESSCPSDQQTAYRERQKISDSLNLFWNNVFSASFTDVGLPDIPFITAAGYMDSDINTFSGGKFNLTALVYSKNQLDRVELYVNNEPTGASLTLMQKLSPYEYLYSLTGAVGIGNALVEGRHLLQLKAFDVQGASSDLWPEIVFH